MCVYARLGLTVTLVERREAEYAQLPDEIVRKMKAVSSENPKEYQLKIIKRQRNISISTGDMFLVQPIDGLFYVGQVIKSNLGEDAIDPFIGGCHLIVIFDQPFSSIDVDTQTVPVDYYRLLIKPCIVDAVYWKRGYFFAKGNRSVPLVDELDYGSGKTMLFRILSGLVKPTTGKVCLNRTDIHKGRCSERIGVIIENSCMWPELTGWENLLFLGSLNKRISKADIRTTLERVGLDPTNPLPIKKYSLGMRQRLIVAQAIMEKPNFLFLDEPTNAIDKEGVLLIRDIIAEEANRGAVVLLASHISQDISTLCTEIYHMKHGRIEE